MKQAVFLFLMFFCVPFRLDAGQTRVISYKVTSQMYDFLKGGPVDTPAPVLEKIQKAFQVWESASGDRLRFRFAGLGKAAYPEKKDIPRDGAIYVVLNGGDLSRENPLESGDAGFEGEPPARYVRGYVFPHLDRGYFVLSAETLIHETGHALGLPHAASLASIMVCGTPAWGDYEVYGVSEQDRADLLRIWAPAAVFSISGTIQTPQERKEALVYAVNIENGHAYSALSDAMGRFTISILRPGRYKLLSKGNEGPAFHDRGVQGPGWYKEDGGVTLDPDGAKVFFLDREHPKTAGLIVKMNEESPGFNFYWSSSEKPPVFSPAFMRPGTSGEFNLTFSVLIGSTVEPVSVESFGEKPDYHVEIRKDERGEFRIKASIDPGAEEGERLVIARGSNGMMQAGLLGLQVVNEVPRFSPANPEDMNGSIQAQMNGAMALV